MDRIANRPKPQAWRPTSAAGIEWPGRPAAGRRGCFHQCSANRRSLHRRRRPSPPKIRLSAGRCALPLEATGPAPANRGLPVRSAPSANRSLGGWPKTPGATGAPSTGAFRARAGCGASGRGIPRWKARSPPAATRHKRTASRMAFMAAVAGWSSIVSACAPARPLSRRRHGPRGTSDAHPLPGRWDAGLDVLRAQCGPSCVRNFRTEAVS